MTDEKTDEPVLHEALVKRLHEVIHAASMPQFAMSTVFTMASKLPAMDDEQKVLATVYTLKLAAGIVTAQAATSMGIPKDKLQAVMKAAAADVLVAASVEDSR